MSYELPEIFSIDALMREIEIYRRDTRTLRIARLHYKMDEPLPVQSMYGLPAWMLYERNEVDGA